MALQHELTLDSGITLPEAYARISGIQHTHNELIVHVDWWANQQARLDLKRVIKQHAFSLPWQQTIGLQDAYNLLKALPEFAGAIDV